MYLNSPPVLIKQWPSSGNKFIVIIEIGKRHYGYLLLTGERHYGYPLLTKGMFIHG